MVRVRLLSSALSVLEWLLHHHRQPRLGRRKLVMDIRALSALIVRAAKSSRYVSLRVGAR